MQRVKMKVKGRKVILWFKDAKMARDCADDLKEMQITDTRKIEGYQ